MIGPPADTSHEPSLTSVRPSDRTRGEARVTYALKILALIVLAAVIVYFSLNIIGRITTVAVIVIGAIFFAYLIYPAVRRLNARLSLGASIAIVYVAFALIIAFGAAIIAPALSENVKEFITNAPSMAHNSRRRWPIETILSCVACRRPLRSTSRSSLQTLPYSSRGMASKPHPERLRSSYPPFQSWRFLS